MLAFLAVAQAGAAPLLELLPVVDVPDNWVKNPQAKSPFSVMVPLTLPGFSSPSNTKVDEDLTQLLDNARQTKLFASLYLAQTGDRATVDALTDASKMILQYYQAQTQSLYGGSGNSWIAVDADAYQALETCVHKEPDNPDRRKACLTELKEDGKTEEFVHRYTGAWGKDVWLADKYFEPDAAGFVKKYVMNMKYEKWGFERTAPTVLKDALAQLVVDLPNVSFASDCSKSGPIPTKIEWPQAALKGVLDIPIDPDQYAYVYKDGVLCEEYREAIARLALLREAALTLKLLSMAAAQPGIPAREKAALKEQREFLEWRLSDWLRRQLDAGVHPTRYFESLNRAITERDEAFRRMVIQGLASNWGKP